MPIELSVNSLFIYLRDRIRSFKFFETKYFQNKKPADLIKKIELSCLLSFLKKFFVFTSSHIKKTKKYQDQKYFEE